MNIEEFMNKFKEVVRDHDLDSLMWRGGLREALLFEDDDRELNPVYWVYSEGRLVRDSFDPILKVALREYPNEVRLYWGGDALPPDVELSDDQIDSGAWVIRKGEVFFPHLARAVEIHGSVLPEGYEPASVEGVPYDALTLALGLSSLDAADLIAAQRGHLDSLRRKEIRYEMERIMTNRGAASPPSLTVRQFLEVFRRQVVEEIDIFSAMWRGGEGILAFTADEEISPTYWIYEEGQLYHHSLNPIEWVARKLLPADRHPHWGKEEVFYAQLTNDIGLTPQDGQDIIEAQCGNADTPRRKEIREEIIHIIHTAGQGRRVGKGMTLEEFFLRFEALQPTYRWVQRNYPVPEGGDDPLTYSSRLYGVHKEFGADDPDIEDFYMPLSAVFKENLSFEWRDKKENWDKDWAKELGLSEEDAQDILHAQEGQTDTPRRKYIREALDEIIIRGYGPDVHYQEVPRDPWI